MKGERPVLSKRSAIDSVVDQFELDPTVLEARQERIDQYRKPYLEMVEKLKEEALAQVSPKPKPKAAAARKK